MAILQRPYAGQVKNLTPPAAGCGGWFLAVGGVICCGRLAAGLAGCGVGRCWRWAAGCCEVWQGVQAVQLVGCGVIGAALVVPVLPGAGGWRNIRVPRPALPGYFPAFPRGGRRQHPARAGLLIRQAGQAGRRRKRKRPGRRFIVRCCSGLLSALAVRSAAPGASRCISWAAGSAPRSGAGVLALALIRAQRFQLATFQRCTACAGGAPSGAFLPFAGGVRFST
nr:MAG: hypothetical protein [Bacteriophage sp.]